MVFGMYYTCQINRLVVIFSQCLLSSLDEKIATGSLLRILHVSLAKDCQILSRQYLAILASQGNMHNKYQAVPLSSHAKVVYNAMHNNYVYIVVTITIKPCLVKLPTTICFTQQLTVQRHMTHLYLTVLQKVPILQIYKLSLVAIK